MNFTDSSVPSSKQLRLAVVMNGGVSLAVWMSGATHELNNCRVADDLDSLPDSSRAAWRAILARVNTKVVIDCVAGASAGGLNGTVLARAIARERDLGPLDHLWFERAALTAGKLLPENPVPATSLLDGNYFLKEVKKLLATEGAPVAEGTSGMPTVSLLVTATALPIAETPDEVPKAVRDSRRVYRFSARPEVRPEIFEIPELPAVAKVNDFDDIDTLALAARASASFPAAFQPVEETRPLKAHRMGGRAEKGRWLMDGGVLDNAPFEPLLTELRKRAVSERFDRAIVYVNPTPPPVPPHGFGRGDQPGILRTLRAFVSATREPDRRLDTQELADARDAARLSVTDPDGVLATLFRTAGGSTLTPEQVHTAAKALFPQYQESRRQSLFFTACPPPSLEGSDGPLPEFSEIPAVLVPSDCGLEDDDQWRWGLGAAGRVLRWWGRALSKQALPDADLQRAFSCLGPAQRLVQQWGDDFDDAVAPHKGDVAIWYCAAEDFLCSRKIPSLLAQLMRATAERVGPALGSSSGRDLLQASLDLEVTNRATTWRNDDMTDVPRFDYWQITPSARKPFDLGKALLPDRDWPHDKLYGERWGHFGAFASEAGRRWDWLWGRIDAALTLSDQIMAGAGVAANEKTELQKALVNAILTEEHQSEPEVRKHAECMHDLSQKELWHRYAIEASPPTRRSLSRIAAELTGTLVPKSWPYAVHALADTQRLWTEHGPDSDLRRASLAGYRAIGLTARTIALLRVKALLKGKLGKQRRRPLDSAAQDARDLQR
jgi:predicted acylesterase/phospholipase RssA